ncbi:P-loop NTPase fold protein [Vibrio campbellii]|uniref:P-loop NTPase fold protein n=1 Tax=Vibrio campbellii TaxID=680 RepID=UPI0038579305
MCDSKKKIHEYSEIIIDLLKRDDLPPMVALDGEWGTGKTFFVKEHLIPDIEKHIKQENDPSNVSYLSLTSIDSINSFRDALISNKYFEAQGDSNLFKGVIDGILTFTSKAGGEDSSAASGAISAIINSSGGALKTSILKKISNEYFILDDIERLSDLTLINKIIGQCLSLSIENKNVKFIFIANFKALTFGDGLEEKFFSGKLHYKVSNEELINHAFNNWEESTTFEHTINYALLHYDLKNIRVIKRLASKIKEVYLLLKEHSDSYDLQINTERAIYAYIRYGVWHYVDGKSFDSILTQLESNRDADWDDFEFDEPSCLYSKEIIEHTCDKRRTISSINDLGWLNKKDSSLDKMIYATAARADHETFEFSLNEIKERLEKSIEVCDIFEWYKSLDMYVYLVENEFSDDDLDIVSIGVNTFINEHKIILNDVNRKAAKQKFNYNFHNQNLTLEFKKSLKDLEDRKEDEDLNSLTMRTQESWEKVDIEYFSKYKGAPILVTKTTNFWFESIKIWNSKSIALFADHIESKYIRGDIIVNEFTSVGFTAESEIVEELVIKLKSYVKAIEIGQKRGALKILIKTLSKVETKLMEVLTP